MKIIIIPIQEQWNNNQQYQQVRIYAHLRGSFFSATVDCIVLTKHVRQTAMCVQGKVCIVALLVLQMTHRSSGQDGGSSWTSSNFSTKESYWKMDNQICLEI